MFQYYRNINSPQIDLWFQYDPNQNSSRIYKIYKLIIIFAIKIQRTKFSLKNIEEKFKS